MLLFSATGTESVPMLYLICSVHLKKKCVYYVPGIVLGAETSAEQSDKNPCPHEFYILVGGGETLCKINTLHTELERDQCYGEKQSSDGGGSKC